MFTDKMEVTFGAYSVALLCGWLLNQVSEECGEYYRVTVGDLDH